MMVSGEDPEYYRDDSSFNPIHTGVFLQLKYRGCVTLTHPI